MIVRFLHLWTNKESSHKLYVNIIRNCSYIHNYSKFHYGCQGFFLYHPFFTIPSPYFPSNFFNASFRFFFFFLVSSDSNFISNKLNCSGSLSSDNLDVRIPRSLIGSHCLSVHRILCIHRICLLDSLLQSLPAALHLHKCWLILLLLLP